MRKESVYTKNFNSNLFCRFRDELTSRTGKLLILTLSQFLSRMRFFFFGGFWCAPNERVCERARVCVRDICTHRFPVHTFAPRTHVDIQIFPKRIPISSRGPTNMFGINRGVCESAGEPSERVNCITLVCACAHEESQTKRTERRCEWEREVTFKLIYERETSSSNSWQASGLPPSNFVASAVCCCSCVTSKRRSIALYSQACIFDIKRREPHTVNSWAHAAPKFGITILLSLFINHRSGVNCKLWSILFLCHSLIYYLSIWIRSGQEMGDHFPANDISTVFTFKIVCKWKESISYNYVLTFDVLTKLGLF